MTDADKIVHELLGCKKHNPHHILGLHHDDTRSVIRLFRPGADTMYCEVLGDRVKMKKIHSLGLFELEVPKTLTMFDYRVFQTDGMLAHDPYCFWPTLGEVDCYLFTSGTHYDIHRKLGSHTMVHQGIAGTSFAVWAPSARSVSLVGSFNHWDGRQTPMRSLGNCGVWEIFIPGVGPGTLYKYEIYTQSGERLLKTDPYGMCFEVRPKTATVVCEPAQYQWHDHEWMESRKSLSLNRPISVYEVHLGSWKRGKDGQFLNYRDLAHELVQYVLEMGFTHVELLPVAEHPLDESWGYQVTGYMAPTSRHGSLYEFQYFVDLLHQHGIGVILDWVPGHFPTDEFALRRFDGTALYEHEDPRQGFHPHWNTAIFNFGRREVSNFLLASALHWLDYCHIDGLRVDAVASMLYLDYGRNEGEWVPNRFGGKENLEAIEFLRHANSIIHTRFPGVLTIAEESTSFSGVTHPVECQGLGFDLKWNMGWMNDTLRYVSKDPIYRKYHHNDLTFNLLYAFSEKFMLVLSHDEVVHGKLSLLSRMPGDMWQKFANLRLLFSYMMGMPGKKLLFQGGEIGQWNEWNALSEVEWFLLLFPYHSGLKRCVQEMQQMYRQYPALWKDDFSFQGFEWVHFHDASNSIISYIRKVPNSSEAILVVHNFTPSYFDSYEIKYPYIKRAQEILNTDDSRYGGSGKVGREVRFWKTWDNKGDRIVLSIPPLATVFYKIEWA